RRRRPQRHHAGEERPTASRRHRGVPPGGRKPRRGSARMSIGDDDSGTFASPPCFMHELDPDGNTPVDPIQARDVARWRKAERKRLVDERMAIPEAVRREHDEAIAAHLLAEIGPVEGICIGAYWPFRGEPDLRPFLAEIA